MSTENSSKFIQKEVYVEKGNIKKFDKNNGASRLSVWYIVNKSRKNKEIVCIYTRKKYEFLRNTIFTNMERI